MQQVSFRFAEIASQQVGDGSSQLQLVSRVGLPLTNKPVEAEASQVSDG
jgi:hypothetical protein